MINIVITAVVATAIIGAIIGVLIAIASVIFHIQVDERVEIIYEMLPHFNCGACGTPGCMAMANELVQGNISSQNCKPSKPEQKEAINGKLLELGCELFKR